MGANWFQCQNDKTDAPVDIEKMQRGARAVLRPDRATEKDLLVCACGSVDPRNKQGWSVFVYDEGGEVPDPELVDYKGMFNPVYRGLTMTECKELWEERKSDGLDVSLPPMPEPPRPPLTVKASELSMWQVRVDRMCRQPNPAEYRDIVVLNEVLGRFGKSAMIKFLVAKRQAIVLNVSSGMDRGAAAANMMRQVASRVESRLPCKIIVVDLPRAAGDDFPWDCLEKIQSGTFLSTKYKTIEVCIDNPHVLVFANKPAPLENSDGVRQISPDRVIQIELRAFHNWLEEDIIEHVKGPQAWPELRDFAMRHGAPGVTLYDADGSVVSKSAAGANMLDTLEDYEPADEAVSTSGSGVSTPATQANMHGAFEAHEQADGGW